MEISWYKEDKGGWTGLARLKRHVFAVRVYPETYKGDRFFTLRFFYQPEGFDTGDGEHFATAKAAKAYAEERLQAQ